VYAPVEVALVAVVLLPFPRCLGETPLIRKAVRFSSIQDCKRASHVSTPREPLRRTGFRPAPLRLVVTRRASWPANLCTTASTVACRAIGRQQLLKSYPAAGVFGAFAGLRQPQEDAPADLLLRLARLPYTASARCCKAPSTRQSPGRPPASAGDLRAAPQFQQRVLQSGNRPAGPARHATAHPPNRLKLAPARCAGCSMARRSSSRPVDRPEIGARTAPPPAPDRPRTCRRSRRAA